MRVIEVLIRLCALSLFLLVAAPAGAYEVSSGVFMEQQGEPLRLEQAQGVDFHATTATDFNFGIGVRPVWLRLKVSNPDAAPQALSLVVGTTWLDHIDAWLVVNGVPRQHLSTGDESFDMPGLAPALGYVWPLNIPAGHSELYVRAESIDPMVLTASLMPTADVAAKQQFEGYRYGAFYGFLAALCIYNLLIFLGMGDRSHLYYSMALLSIALCNLGYTGHALAWLWPGWNGVQRYAVLILMVVYSFWIVQFGCEFLGLSERLPRVERTMRWGGCAALAVITLAVVSNSHLAATYIAFMTMGVFTIAMFVLGLWATGKGLASGRYFLAAAIFGLMGAATTVFTVWGVLPYSAMGFHALEFGVAIEATLLALALALAYQMRNHKQSRLQAERFARYDPLTRVYNRRAFILLAEPLWRRSVTKGLPASLVMLDIDHFKRINDEYGHPVGDRVLMDIARLLDGYRSGDNIVARWGGEEFVLFLPEKTLAEALAIAETLRRQIAEHRTSIRDGTLALTASFGVVECDKFSCIDDAINAVDGLLYEAKRQGRNRVCSGRQNGAEVLDSAVTE